MKLSIIVPVYNVEQYIAICVESILKQTFTEFELLLIDDGSVDNSGDICDKFAKQDNRVKVFHKENGGVSSARNVGIENAQGEWITFIDADDEIDSNYFYTWNSIMEDSISEIFIFSVKTLDIPIKHSSSSEVLRQLANFKIAPSLCLGVFKAELFKDGLYLNEDIHFYEDFEFMFRLLKKATLVTQCNKNFYKYNARNGSVNHMGINEKVLSCYKISDILDINGTLLTLNDVKKIKIVFLSQIVYYMLKTKKPRKDVISKFQSYLRTEFNLLLATKGIDFKTRMILLSSFVSAKCTHSLMSKPYRNHLLKHGAIFR